MKITIDRNHGTAHISINDNKVEETLQSVIPGVLIDYDKNKKLVGIEIIDEEIKTKEEVILSVE